MRPAQTGGPVPYSGTIPASCAEYSSAIPSLDDVRRAERAATALMEAARGSG